MATVTDKSDKLTAINKIRAEFNLPPFPDLGDITIPLTPLEVRIYRDLRGLQDQDVVLVTMPEHASQRQIAEMARHLNQIAESRGLVGVRFILHAGGFDMQRLTDEQRDILRQTLLATVKREAAQSQARRTVEEGADACYDFVVDWPDDSPHGTFLDVEVAGEGVKVGRWIYRDGNLMALRLTRDNLLEMAEHIRVVNGGAVEEPKAAPAVAQVAESVEPAGIAIRGVYWSETTIYAVLPDGTRRELGRLDRWVDKDAQGATACPVDVRALSQADREQLFAALEAVAREERMARERELMRKARRAGAQRAEVDAAPPPKVDANGLAIIEWGKDRPGPDAKRLGERDDPLRHVTPDQEDLLPGFRGGR